MNRCVKLLLNVLYDSRVVAFGLITLQVLLTPHSWYLNNGGTKNRWFMFDATATVRSDVDCCCLDAV